MSIAISPCVSILLPYPGKCLTQHVKLSFTYPLTSFAIYSVVSFGPLPNVLLYIKSDELYEISATGAKLTFK